MGRPLLVFLVVGALLLAGLWLMGKSGPREHSAEIRGIRGVADVTVLRSEPTLLPPKPTTFEYTVELEPDPQEQVFDDVLRTVRRWRGFDATPSLYVHWTHQGHDRQLRLYDGSLDVTAAHLAGLPAGPDQVSVVAFPRDSGGGLRVDVRPRCSAERFVDDCIRAFRSYPLQVTASENEFAGTYSDALYTADFRPGDADRIADLYAAVRAAAPTAHDLHLIAQHHGTPTGTPPTPPPPTRDWLTLRWSTAAVAPGRPEATTQLDAVARLLATRTFPVDTTAEFDGRPTASWRLDRCIEFSERHPLNKRVYAVAHAEGKPALEPADCPAP